jgi:hypothetical protein
MVKRDALTRRSLELKTEERKKRELEKESEEQERRERDKRRLIERTKPAEEMSWSEMKILQEKLRAERIALRVAAMSGVVGNQRSAFNKLFRLTSFMFATLIALCFLLSYALSLSLLLSRSFSRSLSLSLLISQSSSISFSLFLPHSLSLSFTLSFYYQDSSLQKDLKVSPDKQLEAN